jgi:hypothetical protein
MQLRASMVRPRGADRILHDGGVGRNLEEEAISEDRIVCGGDVPTAMPGVSRTHERNELKAPDNLNRKESPP